MLLAVGSGDGGKANLVSLEDSGAGGRRLGGLISFDGEDGPGESFAGFTSSVVLISFDMAGQGDLGNGDETGVEGVDGC